MSCPCLTDHHQHTWPWYLNLFNSKSLFYDRPLTKLWEGNVFSRVCLSFCPWGGEVYHVTITHDAYKDFTTKEQPLHFFKFVHYEARPVGKRVVGILLEYFLVFRIHSELKLITKQECIPVGCLPLPQQWPYLRTVYLVWGGVPGPGGCTRSQYLVPGGVPGPRGETLVLGGCPWSLGGVPGPGCMYWSLGEYLARYSPSPLWLQTYSL